MNINALDGTQMEENRILGLQFQTRAVKAYSFRPLPTSGVGGFESRPRISNFSDLWAFVETKYYLLAMKKYCKRTYSQRICPNFLVGVRNLPNRT